jgi:uncharacterized damage-inducible protein DinB
MTETPSALRTFYDGWANCQDLLLSAMRDLTDQQLGLRVSPDQWAVWQLGSHMAGSRAYWFHDVLREGYPSVREMFRVAQTTVPGLALEDAVWEDEDEHPRSAREIVGAFDVTWHMIDGCLKRWTLDDLGVEFTRQGRTRTQTRSRQWVIWHLIEHELHHGGEISLILGSNGLPVPDI